VSNRGASSEDSATITRRKFTLTEHLDREIEQLAAQHYQGNVSRCLRAAVKEHQHTLDGEGRLALKRLEREVSTLSESVTGLKHDIGEVVAEIERLRSNSTSDRTPSLPGNQFDDAQLLLDELHTAKTPLRVEDLADRSTLSARRVTRALGQLVDLGLIFEASPDGRFQCVMNNPTRPTESQHD
jgi:Arc/MetJ-type ribon-helix-helix transcriptional regulator